MAFAPIFRSPLTDLEHLMFPNSRVQGGETFCTNMQIKYSECIDAYGISKGRFACAEAFYDLMECSHHIIQDKRAETIHNERIKQYKAGKIKKPFEENPPIDTFLTE